MKKVFVFTLALIMILSLAACGSKAKNGSNDESNEGPLQENEVMQIKGYYLRGKEGQNLFVDTLGSPIAISNQTSDPAVFDSLQDGDVIVVTVDGIDETFPSQAGCLACEKIEDGDIKNIRRDVLRTLIDMGWLNEDILPQVFTDVRPEVLGLTEEEANQRAVSGTPMIVNVWDSFLNYALVTVHAPVTEFTAWKLSSDITDEGQLVTSEQMELGKIDALAAGDACIVSGDFGEIVPFIGISFRTEDDELHHYFLSVSGENGDTLLTELAS